MAKIDITKTELVWPGKYNEDGSLREVPRVNLPFQVIERVNESRATREAKKTTTPSLFDFYAGKEGDTFEDGWRNKLIWGDNLLVMGSLLEKFAGKVDLIYIDPPFATGGDFSYAAQIGESLSILEKEPSLIEEKVYRDTWAKSPASYLNMVSPRLSLIRDLLSDTGSLFVHCDWRMNPYLRSILDETFRFRSSIVWKKTNSPKAQSKGLGSQHGTILYYTRSDDYTFKKIWLPDVLSG
jgi:adenine-specific DNA-methyltransferase